MALVAGTQADGYLNSRSNAAYTPLYTAAVVIAVNQAKNSDHRISGWQALIESDAKILIPNPGTEAGKVASIALATGLGAEEGDIRPAVETWAHLKSKDRLDFQKLLGAEDYDSIYSVDRVKEYDAVILWDYQARVLSHISDEWEIVIPEEGSLSVDCGIICGSLTETDDTLRRTKEFLLSEKGRQALEEAGFITQTNRVDLSSWDAARFSYGPIFRRMVLRERLYSLATLLERLVYQTILLILFCTGAWIVLRRVPKGIYRKSSLVTLMFLVLWILFGVLKAASCNDTMMRFWWYAAYIPRHIIPLGWYCMSRLNHYERLPHKKWLILLGSTAVLLSLFVMLNDLHRQVFTFSVNDPEYWNGIYTNQWGYYLSLFWSFSLSIAGIVLLFAKSKTRRQIKQLSYAGAAFFLVLIYQGLYIIGVRYIIELDIPTTVAVIILVFILAAQKEQFMDASIIAIPIFKESLYAIAVYNRAGQAVFCNNAMLPIIQDAPELSGFPGTTQNQDGEMNCGEKTFQLRNYQLPNGRAILAEDITEIRHAERELQETCQRLAAVQVLLSRKVSDAFTATGTMEKKRYMLHMNGLFSGKLSEVCSYLRKNSVGMLHVPAVIIRRARLLIYICQRRIRFILRSLESHPILSSALLEKYISGLNEDAVRLGLDTVVTSNTGGDLPEDILTVLLETVDGIFLHVFDNPGLSLILRLEANEEGLSLIILFSDETLMAIADRERLAEQMAEAVSRVGGRISRDQEEDGLRMHLYFSYKEVQYALV